MSPKNERSPGDVFEDADEAKFKLVRANDNNNTIKDVGDRDEPSARGIFAQCVLTGAVMLGSAGCGMPIGYSAILLPQLKTSNGSLQIDDEVGSWIASMHSAATPLGSLLSGILMERYGRKLALQLASIPLVIGWILIALSPGCVLLLIGRLTAGVSVGLIAAPGQVLIGEISEPRTRGIFTSVPFGSYSFGILLVYALGSWLHWRAVAGLSVILPVVAAIIFFFLPESPVWLSRKGRHEEARLSLSWFRGGDVMKMKAEMRHLTSRTEEETLRQQEAAVKSRWRQMTEPQILKPFLILNVFNLMQTLSGTYLVVFYAVDIISQIGGRNMDSFLVAVLTACVRFMFTVVASVLLAFVGRRALALTSGIGTAASSLALGVLLCLPHEHPSNGYLTILFVFLYVALNTIGFMILPGVLLGELYPANFRGFGGGVTFMLFHVTLFVAAKVFPFLKTAVGVNGVFLFFGLCSIFASLFLYLMLPETKGKTLNQIEDYFVEKNLTWVGRSDKLKRKQIYTSV